jgi:uncharacterized protein (TIGR02246 family)
MNPVAATPEAISALFRDLDAAFAAGDAEGYAALFCHDGVVHLHHSPPLVGREAIRERWQATSERFDTSAWKAQTERMEVHGDRAYAVRTYAETLVPIADGPRIDVAGRLVAFLRREPDGGWRVALLMNNHTRPMEELP